MAAEDLERATRATWFLTSWLKWSEGIWPDVSDPRAQSIARLTKLDPLDYSEEGREAVSKALFDLSLAELNAEYERRSGVTERATRGYIERGMQTVSTPNLPSTSPLADLFGGIFGSVPWWVWAAGAAAVAWWLTKGKGE